MTPAADAVALWAIAARITEFGFMGLSAPADILVVTAPGVGRRTRFQVVVPTGQRFEERVRSLSSQARD